MEATYLIAGLSLGLCALLAPFVIKRAKRAKEKENLSPEVKLTDLNYRVPIERYSDGVLTNAEAYWTGHTVRSVPFKTASESLTYLDWRSSIYPFFHELMGLWGNHEGQVVLDYGCGPANDVVGFLAHSKAKQVIGIDVSETALRLASHRLSLHEDLDLSRVRLIQVSDIDTKIPLPDNSVDYIYTEGVLHHTTDPLQILTELQRVLKPGGEACIMVYNRDSIWLHLYIPYEIQLVNGKYKSFNVEEAFARTTDGENCPLARCYRPRDFIAMCQYAGFEAEFVGAYYSQMELDLYKRCGKEALEESRLPYEHREFLKAIVVNDKGIPTYRGKYAGVGAVFKLKKPAKS